MLIGRNESGDELEKFLKQAGIQYTSTPQEWLNSMNTNCGMRYDYKKDGEKRVAYEVSCVIAPDDYVMISCVFNHEPTEAEIRDALNGR